MGASALVAVKNLSSGVTAIATGEFHSCAIADGTVYCWGRNDAGQLGDGTTTNDWTPKAVPGLSAGATAVSAGYYHSCALVNGGVLCWGTGVHGQLGNGNRGYSPIPTLISVP
jgi:alpha-tubulin suppressor-like RCC1 family protein